MIRTTGRSIPVLCLVVPACAIADDFDLCTKQMLAGVPAAEGVRSGVGISLLDLSKIKPVLSGTTGTLVVIQTDEGNWAKLLVSFAARKGAGGAEPIAALQRYYTFRQDSDSGRLAAGKDVNLFDGFQFNLDIGQVVPDGHGGDIAFHRRGDRDGVLQATGKAKLFVPTQPILPPGAAAAGPSRGPVVAADFQGTFRVVANGQWSGVFRLTVSKSGEVKGTYLSDQTGRDFPVDGFVATPPHRIRLTVKLPQTQQEFDGYLWTRGKTAFAGTTTMEGRSFGFVAVREGAELMPADD